MDRSKAPLLQSLALSARPLTSHAVVWSCDAELAVTTADGIYIFLPEYPQSTVTTTTVAAATGNNNNSKKGRSSEPLSVENLSFSSNPQFPLFMQTLASLRPDTLINAPLCRFAGIHELPPPPSSSGGAQGVDDGATCFPGVGSGRITAAGAALGHVIRVEWSPGGLGWNLRPVLVALTTHGAITCLGEQPVDIHTGGGASASQQKRSFKNWRILWGLGAHLPLPVVGDGDGDDDSDGDGDGAGVKLMDERITSFSWAAELGPGCALLAYVTDDKEVVVMSVQFYARADDGGGASDEYGWELRELARFDGRGVHIPKDALDPDFSSSGSAFSLKWSPWVTQQNGKQTATLSYIANNYVGFRRVTLEQFWKRGDQPLVTVESHDTKGLCLWLSTDAFLEWENMAWEDDDGTFYMRGVIASPFTVHPFQIPLTGPLSAQIPRHETNICSTTYPKETSLLTNPISDPSNRPPVPRYTLVRQSCTPTNQDWFQTTLPADEAPLPQWAEDLGQRSIRRIRLDRALRGKDIDSDDSEDEDMDPGPDVTVHDDDQENSGAVAEAMDVTEMRPTRDIAVDPDHVRRVHPRRFRLWGLAASPGDGCTAAIVSKYNTQHPSRRDRAEVMFGWRVPGDEAGMKTKKGAAAGRLTTEARVWEWMYGGGDHVVGTAGATDAAVSLSPGSPSAQLRSRFRSVLGRIGCVFCDEPTREEDGGRVATCSNGHGFATCAATGIPIMAPDISRVCAVCGLRCIKPSELARLAREHGEDDDEDVTIYATAELCGGCGGKFIV